MTTGKTAGETVNWIEIVLDVAFEDTNAFSDALLEAGALSVTVEDADEGTPREKPIFDEPGADSNEYAWERSRIIALLSPDTVIAELLKNAANECNLSEIPSYSLRDVPQEDWVRVTQSQFDPIHIGEKIWIVPSWHEVPDKSGIVLELDPGLAFGTGSHPTTSLCLEWLEKNVKKDLSILDYGCGSGILSIAAKKLSAKTVTGVDIDPQSVATSRENAARNHCQMSCYLPEEFSTSEQSIRYDIVVANILAGPLKTLVSTLCGRIAPGGFMVLSGILEGQADDVIAAYAPCIKLSVWKNLDGWVALSGQLDS